MCDVRRATCDVPTCDVRRATCRRATCCVLVALLAFGALGSAGCGYSLAGRGSFLPTYIQRIGVPLFLNHTPVYDIERKLTDRVRGELAGRGKYKVDPVETGVDAVLTGEITAVTLVP